MFLDEQLGNGCVWINLDVEKIKNLEIYLKSTDWIRKPSNMRWIKMNVPTWITTVRMGL